MAKKHNIAPATFANAFVNCRPFITSNIIGATSLEQLKENIDSVDINLSEEILKEIGKNPYGPPTSEPCLAKYKIFCLQNTRSSVCKIQDLLFAT